jgi:hypothetical protein
MRLSRGRGGEPWGGPKMDAMPTGAPALLHIVGYLTGASLFAMLLVMVLRSHGPAYRLTLGTALLGVAWNLGELTAHVLDSLQLAAARDWLSAMSYAALGLLAAVVVHSAARPDESELRPPGRAGRALAAAAYACAGVAGFMQLAAAATGDQLPSSAGLMLLTIGLTLLSLILLVTTRGRPRIGRAAGMIALALFAVSALHLGRFHGASESWVTELLGHHASIPLAFAILYQDYRFAFADLFLKRALTLLTLVAIVFVAWSLVEPSITQGGRHSVTVGLLLALWVGTALVFPVLRRLVAAFVDRIVLKRSDYGTVIEQLSSRLQSCESERAVLSLVATSVSGALGAASVSWQTAETGPAAAAISILTAEPPQHVLAIGTLSGGRRLLSDDLMMLERVSGLAGRRIDALRISDERYERMLREREIATLAAEAELRALRAQINPHFLFNALTTLGYLIQHAPSRAFDTLMRLTTLLRSVLRSEGEFTTLGHERELIACYLDIERERFEERLESVIDIPVSLSEVPIPALIVQPLVENAIKHGIANARHGGRVHVAARVETTDSAADLCITVRNSGAPLHRDRISDGGIGLQNVQQRLRCYYGDEGILTLESDAASGETVATLRLPGSDLALEERSLVVERRRR